MDDEMKSLIENKTFTACHYLRIRQGGGEGGGHWVNSVRDGPNEMEIFKACYVAKGYLCMVMNDYFATFAPTAIQSIIQNAAQYD